SISAPKPPNMGRIVEINRGPFVGAQPEPQELPLPPVEAQVLDVRRTSDFAAGHLPGAVNVPVSGASFPTKAGFVLDPERSVVVAANDEREVVGAVRGLRSVAFLDIEGYVLGGGPETLGLVSIEELDEVLATGVALIDVR